MSISSTKLFLLMKFKIQIILFNFKYLRRILNYFYRKRSQKKFKLGDQPKGFLVELVSLFVPLRLNYFCSYIKSLEISI